MQKFFSLKHFAFLGLVLFGSLTAYSQCTGTTACETNANIDEDFTGGPGSFQTGLNFGYNSNVLRSDPKGAQNKLLDTLNSQVYTAGAEGSVLTYRFTLGSVAGGTVSSYKILARYSTTNPNSVVELCSGTTLSNGVLCFNYTVDPILANQPFRFEFIFNLSGSGNGSRITFDNFATNAAESPSQTILPVTFAGFKGKKVSSGTQLTWKVAGEVNVKEYEIERSARNNGGFVKIGAVPATGASAYSFTDGALHNGAVFYRIKNVDADGAFKYSTILAFRNGAGELVLRVVPTVVSTGTSVEHGAATGSEHLTLSTADGRVVRTLRPAAGSLKTNVDLSSLQSGLYLLKWADGKGRVETVKLVKQ